MFPTVGGYLRNSRVQAWNCKRDIVACFDADLLVGIMLVGIMLVMLVVDWNKIP